MSEKKEYKSFPIGEMRVKEVKDENGNFVPSYFEVKDQAGNIIEYVPEYQIKVFIPQGIDEAGCGEPSAVLKNDQFVNVRGLTQREKEELPGFLKNDDNSSKVMCKLRLGKERKQYPKKEK